MLKRNRQSYIIIFLLLLSTLCEAKLVEKAGNTSLKRIKQHNPDMYTGISEESTDLQSAFNSAVSHAQSQIIQNLGIQTKINIQVNDYIFDSEQTSKQEISIKKQSTYSGLFHLNLKAESVYWEKHQTNNEFRYLAWVNVPFSKQEYIKDLEAEFVRLINQMETLTKPSGLQESSNKDFVLQMIKISKSLYEFETENAQFKAIISKDIAENYQQHYIVFEDLWAEVCRNLSIRFINSDDRFPKQVYIHLSYLNQDLKNFNLYVKSKGTQILKTNESGMLEIEPNYTHFIRQEYQISLVPESEIYKNLPDLKFTLFSPLYNENIRLLVNINSELPNDDLHNEISQAIRNKGFQYYSSVLKSSQPVDFKLNIQLKTTYLPKLTKVSQYFYDTIIVITLTDLQTNQIIRQWQYPNTRFPQIRSSGSTKLSAQSHAIGLKGLANRQELWVSMIQEIEQLIKKKKW